MSLPKRISLTQLHPDLKHRVATCLNKLSDRDTLAVATTELESIAVNLSLDSYAPFLTCLSNTSSSEKSPVRQQCVRLLGLLSATHGDALSPHLSKMISAVLRRLRDPDSAVRSACVDAISSMASQITKPRFSSFSKPFVEAILTEQDYNSQIGSALCLAAAIEASPDPEPAQLHKFLPRFLKLIKTNCFKAKPALLSLFGSIASSGGSFNPNSLNCLIPCLVEFLSSEDWAARKAAVEALGRLAVSERSHLAEFKSSCLASLESRRFDKVKVVRETMNRALELWKEIPEVLEEVSPQSKSKSSSKDSGCGRYSATVSKSPHDIGFKTPPKEILPTSTSPPIHSSSATTSQNRSPLKSNCRKRSAPIARKLDFTKHSDWKVNVAVPRSASSELACNDNFRSKFGVSDTVDSESCIVLGREKEVTRQIISDKTCDDKFGKVGGFRFGSRVVPFHENRKLDVANGNATEDVYGKDIEDLSLIQKQLVQIENQQSNLLNLLQKFMGSSKSGMNSLETRVNGLEKALDDISYDLAMSTGRISNTDTTGNTCCMLAGAEFLSPKFWRRTEGQYSTSRLSSPGRNQSLTDRCYLPDKDSSAATIKQGQQKRSGGIVVNTLGSSFRDSGGNLESFSNTRKKLIQTAEMVQNCNSGRLDGGSFTNRIQQQT